MTNSKRFFVLIFGILCGSIAQAQEKMSIDDCVAYALKNNLTLRNSGLDQEKANAQVNQIKGIGLPQVSGAADFNANINLPTQFLPDFISPAVVGTLIQTGVLPPTTPLPPAGIIPAQFGTNYSASLGLTLTQIIFSPSYLIGLQAARESKNLYSSQTQISEVTLKEGVKKAALGCLVAQKRIEILTANLVRIDESLRQLRAINTAGFVEKLDVDRLVVARNNLTVEKQNVEQLISLANLALKLQMGMPLSTDLTITDALDKLVAAAQPDPNQALNPENRPEYRTAMAGKTLQELNLRNAKAGYLPNLIGFATAGANSGVNDFKNIVKVKDYWFGYQIVGLKLQVPIFDGFQTKYKIKEAQIDLQKTENQVKELTQVFELQLAQSKINLAANSARLQMQKQNMELAQEILRVSQIKYQTGVGSSLEITNAEAGLKEAQTNYFVSLYDFLISKIDYEKALGQL